MVRVVITGLGPVAPNGIGIREFWDALMTGRSGIGRIRGFDTSGLGCEVAGEVAHFDPEAFMDRRRAERMARFSQLAVAAACLAMDDAGIDRSKASGAASRGVCLGTTNNALDLLVKEIGNFIEKAGRRMRPWLIGTLFPHAAASEVAISCGCEGPVTTVSAACAAGSVAIGQALDEIRSGRAEVMLAGGAEGSVTPFLLSLMCATQMVPTGNIEDPTLISRPFDGTRKRGVLSEGSGVVVLESLPHALKRRARIYAEVFGYASNTEAAATVLSAADDDTYLERTMRLALDAARVRPGDVDYISAHAPSDGGDARETRAIKAVLGAHAYNIAVSSIKSMIGNPLAAAGPLQVIATARALWEQRVPPTINYSTPDPECDLDYVPNRPRACRANVALVNSHGLGGVNHCIVLGRYPRENGAAGKMG